MTETIDLVRSDRAYYSASGTPECVTFPTLPYLAVSGSGEPGGETHLSAIEALYTLASAIRARSKPAGITFAVPKLEGLWWVEGPGDPLATPRSEWMWTLLLRLPEAISVDDVARGREAAARKKPGLKAIERVTSMSLTEGACVQAMHVGSYATEPETLDRLQQFMDERGLVWAGKHHEIYLFDPKRGTPERARTILRHPVAPAGAPGSEAD